MLKLKLIICAAAVTISLPSAAHHGFSGRYDISRPIWIEGVVTRAYFGQPHAELTVRTDQALRLPSSLPDLAGAGDIIEGGALQVRDDTRGREVSVEFPPISAFFGLGRRVSAGDRVSVIAFRNCEAPHQLRGQWVQPATGTPVARSGRVQSQVRGC